MFIVIIDGSDDRNSRTRLISSHAELVTFVTSEIEYGVSPSEIHVYPAGEEMRITISVIAVEKGADANA